MFVWICVIQTLIRGDFSSLDGRVVRASVSVDVVLCLILSRVQPMTLKLVFTAIGVDLVGAGGRRPLESNTEGGDISRHMSGLCSVLIPMLIVKCMRSSYNSSKVPKHKILVMLCRNVTLTLFKWRKENYQRVFSDDSTGSVKNRFNLIAPELFFRASTSKK